MDAAHHSAPPPAAAEPSLRPDTIGLTSSVVIGMAGAAPGQVLAIALVPLITSTAYGIVPSILITTATMLCIAVAFNRLNLWNQDCGGPYKWVGRAVNPYAGFIVGWLLFATFAVTVLVDLLTIGPAVLGLLGLDTSDTWGTVTAAMILGLPLVAIAAVGIRPTARLQIALAVGEYVIILVFAALAAYAIFGSHQAGTFTPTADFLKFDGTGSGTFAAGMLVAIFWIAEWDAGIYENEETTRRERNPGLAAIIAVALLGVLYTITAVLFACVAPQADMEANAENALVFVADRVAGGGWAKVMALAVVSSVLATVLASLIVVARIALSMSRDRVMPRIFGKIDSRFRTPLAGTLIIGLVGLILVWPYVFVNSVAGALDTLISTVGVIFAVYYSATGLTVAWLYRGRLFLGVRDFVLSGVAPVASAGFLIWVAYQAVRDETPAERWTLTGILVIGVVILLVAHFVYRAPILRTPPEKFRGPGDIPRSAPAE